MLGSMLAHGGDASGLGLLAFFPVGLLLLVGIILALRPALTGSGPGRADDEDGDPAEGPQRDPGEGRG